VATSAELQHRFITQLVRIGLLATLGCFPREDLSDYSTFPPGSGSAGNNGGGAGGSVSGGAGGASGAGEMGDGGVDALPDADAAVSAPDTGPAPVIDAGDLDASDAAG
jgi:hypothetical protein